MDYQLWKIYWAFRNGDYDLSGELLAMFWTSTTETTSLNLDSIKGCYGDTLLHLACQNGWLDYVKLLVEGIGYESKVKDCGNQTPLHYACHYGHLEVVQYLIKVHNCDVAAATRDHWTPLHYACRYGHLNIVEYTLGIPGVTSRKQLQVACVYDLNYELLELMNKEDNSWTIEPTSVLLQIACSLGQVQLVQYLCNKNSSHMYLHDIEIRRLFMFCCKHGLLEIVTKLRPNVSHYIDTQGKSGLHYACQLGHVSIARHLIEERGCDINRVDINGYTPLYLACQHSNDIDMVKYILNKLKCTHISIKALSLMFCKEQWSDSQCIDIINLLMSTKEWNPTSSCNSNGDTVLHLSAKHNRPNVAQFLLLESNFQIHPNVRNTMGETPLKQTSNPEIIKCFICLEKVEIDNEIVDRLLTGSTQKQESVCVEILRLMVKNGQWDPNSSCNSRGDTALHLSVRYCRPMVAHFLLSENNCNPNRKNQDGVTPLDLATDLVIISLLINSKGVQSNPDNSIFERVLTHSTYEQDSLCIDIIRTLTKAGQWNPTLACNSRGDTVLHLSVQLHRPVLTHFLLSELKYKPNIKNLDGETPIQLMIQFFSDSECTYLIKLIVATISWYPNSICNSERDTALHLSALFYKPRLTDFLIFEAGCSPNVKNQEGKTPLYLLLSVSQWRDSECINVINPLITARCWYPNSACDSEGNTILHLAALYHRPEIAEFMLLEATCYPHIRNAEDETPLQVLMPTWSDLECISIIKLLITTKKWDPNLRCNSQNDTVLHLATRHHKYRVVDFLLFEAKCDPIMKNRKGETPMELLMSAHADSECTNLIQTLYSYTIILNKQWDPNLSYSSMGDTLLHLCAKYNRPNAAHFLISEAKCDPNIRNKRGETPIHLLISSLRMSDSECFKLVKDIAVTTQWYPNSMCNSNGDTALHLSVIYHKPKVAQFLISEAKCDPNIENKIGETPIYLLMSVLSDSECFNMMRDIIVTKQWDHNSRCNYNGDTALHLSVRHHKPRVTLFLLSKAKCDPNIRNKMKETLIELLIHDANKWLDYECADVIKELVAAKQWDPNSSCSSKGDTALHLSVRHHKPKAVGLLLSEAKCNPYVRNTADKTPIHLIISDSTWSDTECLIIFRVLIATKQWNPNSSCNSIHDTPLHLSTKFQRPKVVQFLLSEAKCDPKIKNKRGETPIHLLMLTWSDTECASMIRVLMATKQWDPDSSCNSKGDTALHLSIRCHRRNTVKLLLSEAKCNPYVINEDGKTPVYLLMSTLSNAKCTAIIKILIATEQWNPTLACNSKGDTALHLSVRHHKPRVTEFLLSEAKCDPNIINKMGETLIELLICDTDKWFDSECVDIIKAVVATKQWNPNSNYNPKGDTALHLCARHCRPKAVNLLLFKVECDPYIRNKEEETPIHLLMSTWSDTFCTIVFKVLIATKKWNPNLSCNSIHDTPLHLSVRHFRPKAVQLLLSKAKCDPNIRNKIGETPIHLLMSAWSDSECFNIIRELTLTKHWDPNSRCNSKDDTALHLSVRHHKSRVAQFLLADAKCDPNLKNLGEETPLQLANDTDINDLIRYGSNPDNVYKLYGKSVKLKKPLKPPVKVFIIGNSGVGKSTLTEALKIEVSFLTRAFTTRRRVSDVDAKTAGIVPHDFESKKYGRVTLYDFAGQREFYSTHAAFLYNVIQTSSPIFLLVVNMSVKNDTIKQHILYWLSFVENQCHAINCQSYVIVIGSHADIVLSGGNDPQQKAMEISESIIKTFQSSVVQYVAICPMDCQYPESSGMTKLRSCLVEICNVVRIPEVITFNAHCFHVFLLDKFRTYVAVTVQEIQDQVMREQNTKEGIAKFLPDTFTTICKVCDELNNRGHILFLKNADDIENSWVIIDKTRLLSEVTGTIFAPKDFKQHCQLAESTGVVPLSKLTKHFPHLKTEVLTGFMIHLEFCREILDSELLELIMKHQESLNNTDTSTSDLSERYFLFPGLITQQAPGNLWEQSQDFKHHCGWILQCMSPNQFFSSRFLQVLLLRLAFSFALVKVEVEETFPAFQRECSIWKNGIFWGEILGLQIIIEVHSSNKTVILQIRCHKEHLVHCIAQRSHIIRKILQCTRDFCPQIKTVESFIDPSEATKFPIKFIPEIPRFNLQKIAEAIVKFSDHHPLSVVSSRRTILLDRLVIFEPYAEIGQAMLKNLHSYQNDDVNIISNQVLETLCLKLSRKANLFVKIFKECQLLHSTTPEDLLTVLQQWRDGCEGTYKCLKEKLDQYSVFAGRNILVSSYTSCIKEYNDTFYHTIIDLYIL